jgi:hypothetical protein
MNDMTWADFDKLDRDEILDLALAYSDYVINATEREIDPVCIAEFYDNEYKIIENENDDEMTEGQKELQHLLSLKTQGCEVQHNGYPCNTCFHAMELGVSNEGLHEMWEATLLYRGDYTIDEIPMTEERMLNLVNQLTNLLRVDLGEWD